MDSRVDLVLEMQVFVNFINCDLMTKTPTRGNAKSWLKKLGLTGFLFFLIKGLVWLGVFYFAGKGCSSGF